MAANKSGLRSLEGSVDPRAWGCRGVMPSSRHFLSTTAYPIKDQGGEECSDTLASLTRSPVSSVGRAYLTCKQKVVGSNPTLGRYFSTQVYLIAFRGLSDP